MAEPRILIAPQEYKGTLTAVEAAEATARALAEAFPGWRTDVLPMADGGPGTTRALLAALGGERRTAAAHDPLMRDIEAEWGLLPGRRAVVECAAASGLLRLHPDELDPRRASSFGTGELIVAALSEDVDELIVGLGGSATNDGGAGMAQALGFRLLDASGRDLPPGGATLRDLDRIDPSPAHPRLRRVRCIGATDVTNPLCGPTGASAIYGPQKGADAAAIEQLDAALRRLAQVIERDLGTAVAERPGAGAAGGLGAALIAFLGADLQSGARVVGEAAGIRERIGNAAVVITGEGRLDGQTVFGKTPQYVAQVAQEAGVPVICLAGSFGPGYETALPLFAAAEAMGEAGAPLPSPREASRQLAQASVRALRALVARGLVTGLL